MQENYIKNYFNLQEQKFQNHKLFNNDLILKLNATGFKKESEQVRCCCSYLLFSRQENLYTGDERIKFKEANFCKFRFCSACNWRRSLNINKSLLKAFTAIEKSKKVSYLFLTLTVKNVKTSSLKATIKHMNESFRRLSKTKAFKSSILGYFKSLEILGDKTARGEVHPHFHIILVVSSSYFNAKYYISQRRWSEMWQRALRVDYLPVVDVRRIKSKIMKDGRELTALQSAVFEVAKYSIKHIKLTERSNEEFRDIINQTKNMRFFTVGGILREKINLLKCDNELMDFDNEVEDLWIEIEDLLYKWSEGNYLLKEVRKLDG